MNSLDRIGIESDAFDMLVVTGFADQASCLSPHLDVMIDFIGDLLGVVRQILVTRVLVEERPQDPFGHVAVPYLIRGGTHEPTRQEFCGVIHGGQYLLKQLFSVFSRERVLMLAQL